MPKKPPARSVKARAARPSRRAAPARDAAAAVTPEAPAYTPRRWSYGVHPIIDYTNAIIANMPAKTGRSLEQWAADLRRNGPKGDEAAQTAWLKKQGLGMNNACMVIESVTGRLDQWRSGPAYLRAAQGFVDAMYAGKKAWMRPLHDALMAACLSVAKDVKACPCETIVPIYRTHVIAQIKPGTISRIDFGLALGSTKAAGRLIDTGGFAKKDRITHRIEVRSEAEVDPELLRWLRRAYEMDA